MPRTLTEDGSGNLTFQERATDVDQDQITVETVELDAIDGVGQTGASRTPAWLSHTTTFNPGDPSEMLIDVTLVASQLSIDTTYTFLFEVSDGIEVTQRTVDLVVSQPVISTWDGTRIYHGDDDQHSQRDLSTAYVLEGSTTSTASVLINAESFYIKTSGDVGFIGTNDPKVEKRTIGTDWDITTLNSSVSQSFAPSDVNSVDGLWFKPDGSKLFISGNVSSDVKLVSWDLATPFDLSTRSNKNVVILSTEFAGISGSIRGIFFDKNGDYMFAALVQDQIIRFTLSTPFDINTLAFGDTGSEKYNTQINNADEGPEDVFISPDGLSMFIVGSGNTKIYQVDMTDPYDLTGSELTQAINISVPSNKLHWLAFGS